MRSILILAGLCAHASAATALTALHSPVVYDFSSFTGAGFSPNATTAGSLDSNNWAASGFSDGSVAYGDTKTSGDFARGTSAGGVSTGGVYAFNTGLDGIGLGVQPILADFNPGSFTLRLQNLTNSTLTAFQVAYDVFAYNDQGRSNTLNFSYSVNGTTFFDLALLNFTSPEAADPSPSWAPTSRATTISGLGVEVAPAGYFYARWSGADLGGSGSRDQFAIDNISIAAVPEPAGSMIGLLLLTGLCHRRRKQTARRNICANIS